MPSKFRWMHSISRRAAAAITLGAILGVAEPMPAPSFGGVTPLSIDEVAACTPEINRVSGSKTQLARLTSIDGRLGGVATLGRWTLIVPPGAYGGRATIRMTIPDQSKMEIDLSISPANLNAFNLPVLLRANNQGGAIATATDLKMFYFNPSTGCWDNVTSGLDVASVIVEAQLWHFSKYSSGKSGW